jgi:hypothetical protein
MREIPQCWLTGQAAGVRRRAGRGERATCARCRSRPLRQALRGQGVVLREPVERRPGDVAAAARRAAPARSATMSEPDRHAPSDPTIRRREYRPLHDSLARPARGIDALDTQLVELVARRAMLVDGCDALQARARTRPPRRGARRGPRARAGGGRRELARQPAVASRAWPDVVERPGARWSPSSSRASRRCSRAPCASTRRRRGSRRGG